MELHYIPFVLDVLIRNIHENQEKVESFLYDEDVILLNNKVNRKDEDHKY